MEGLSGHKNKQRPVDLSEMATTVPTTTLSAPTASITSTSDTQVTTNISVSFYGGLDLVFAGKHDLDVSLPTTPGQQAPTMGTLIEHLTHTYLADSPKKSLFSRDGSVTPGILVLVNEADWELEGREEAELNDRDEVVFVSTLHGG